MKPVTDPALLSQLDAGSKEVTDPALLRRLDQTPTTAGSYLSQGNPADPYQNLSYPTAQADVHTGGPAGLRALTSIKTTPEGRANYLRSQLGDDNVHMRPDGELFIKGESGQWVKLDENPVTMRDFADMVGGSIEFGPAIAGGVLTGANPLGAAAGAGAGATIRHGVSAAIPGSDEQSLTERAADIGSKAAMAGLTQYGVNKLMAPFINAARPHNLVAKQINKSMETPYGIKGQRLTQQTGVPLTLGQQSGSKQALMMEGMLRRNPFSVETMDKANQKALASLNFNLKTFMNRLASGSGDEQLGNKIGTTYKSYMDKLWQNRAAQAADDIAQIEQIGGNQPMFSLNNLVNKIDDLIDQHSTPIGSDNANKILKGLTEMREKITGFPQRSMIQTGLPSTERHAQLVLTPKQLQRTLEIYGKAAAGKDKLIPDLDDVSTSKYINKQLFKALNDDLDNIASSDDAFGDTAKLLRQFRDNYRKNSQSIGEAEQNVLGRLFGGNMPKSPEAVVEKFMRPSSMKPSELKAAFKVLDEVDPSVAGEIKRAMVEHIMDKGRPAPSMQQANGVRLSPNRFNSEFNKLEDNIRAVFSREEYADIKRLSKVMERMSDRAGTDGSPTAPLLWMANVAKDAAKAAFTLNPAAATRLASTTITAQKMAQAMTTEQGRQAIRTLLEQSPTTRALESAVIYISSQE